MQKRFLISISLNIIILFFFSTILMAENKIFITGNKNIPSGTIENLYKKNFQTKILDKNKINEFQKKIFETGFFESVSISIKNDIIYLTVKENPIINFFYIEGIKSQKLLENIEKSITLKEGKIFSLANINQDLETIKTILKQLGYHKPKINYKLKKIENNKLNIFYEISPNNRFKTKRIFFIGDKHFKSSTLIDVVSSTEYGWWKFFSNSYFPSSDRLFFDNNNLKNFYLNKGFYDVQISSSSIEILDNEFANIVFSINSGKNYIFDSFELLDNSKSIPEKTATLIKKLITEEILNKEFSNNLLTVKSKKIENILINDNLDIDLDIIHKKTKDQKIGLFFNFNNKKSLSIVNKIIFKGNSITEDKVLRNQFLFSEGDILSNRKLLKSIDKIKDTEIFKDVKYYIKDNSFSENSKDIIVEVTEQPTGEVTAGVSAGSSGADVVSSIKEKNFLGKGINLGSSFSIGTEKILADLSISNPDFNSTGNRVNTRLFILNNDFNNSGYESKAIGATVGTKYEIFQDISFSPGFGVDYDKVDIINLSNSNNLKDGNFYTNKIYYNLIKDVRNRKVLTSSGYTAGLGQTFALYPSDIPFIKNSIFGSYYNEIYDNFLGSIRYNISSINGIGEDIKFSDRLTLNENQIRGFSKRGIGPKSGQDYIGGNYSYNVNFGTTIPNGLPDKWNAKTNIFFDIANVWGVDYSESIDDSNKIRSSIGIGLSWMSPIGPIGLSYAEPISKESTDDVQQFNFKIGSVF